jgi:signal transduction histidine kinase
MVRSSSDGRFALAGVSMDFLSQLGRQIGFGKGGHAAIVDARGRVLWHPKEEWRKEMKDLSAVRPVKAMLERQSGAMTFFSPATQSEMVVGYSVVPRTGWGVMVPMPMAEIEARVSAFGRAAWFVALLGLVAALVASWFVARYLARPIREVAGAANKLAAGRLDVRAPVHAHPTELRELGAAFNAMADEVAAKNIALSEAAGRAEAASRTKSDFLANVSHEVRTPLNAILGFAELMRTAIYGPLGHPKYLGYAENIHASASHLLGLVNSVLDLSKAESGTLDIAFESVDVVATIDACLPMVEPQAKAGGVRIERLNAQHLPLAHADSSRLKQVLINLLSNAVKFTPAGGVVSVEAERTEAGGVRVRVRDTGIGIAAEDIPQVLSAFGRTEKQWLRNNSGAGIGLPLSRRIMNAMGGTISLSSTPGLGTVATVEIAPAVANTRDTRPLAAQ